MYILTLYAFFYKYRVYHNIYKKAYKVNISISTKRHC